MRKRSIYLVGLIVSSCFGGFSPSALALEGYPTNWCRGGMFGGSRGNEPNLHLGRIVGRHRAYLLSDAEGCPFDVSKCRKRTFAMPGAHVVVQPGTLPGFACVFYTDGRYEATGWLPQEEVEVLPDERDPPLSRWEGIWRQGDNTIVLKPNRDGTVSAQGKAYWPGRSIPPAHSGQFTATARPNANRLAFIEGDAPYVCRVDLQLLNSGLLAATDNGGGVCGGANVSFGGVYVRSRR